MTTFRRVLMIYWFLALTMSYGFAQGAQQTNTVPKVQPHPQKQGLLDFALQRVNSSDRDYGQCIDEGRRLLLENTVENVYFWSNLVAVGLLGGFFIVIVHQHRVQKRREIIVAETLEQYQHALSRAEVQLDDATRRNHAFMEAYNSSNEVNTPSEPVQPKAKVVLALTGKDAPKTATVKANAVPAYASGARAEDTRGADRPGGDIPKSIAPVPANSQSPVAPVQRTKVNPDVDLVAKINLLQQQLSGTQEREKQMRRQLNDAELRLQKEQQKNRSLKGE
jgi:hypothetical protein